jgi:hypothetical protein
MILDTQPGVVSSTLPGARHMVFEEITASTPSFPAMTRVVNTPASRPFELTFKPSTSVTQITKYAYNQSERYWYNRPAIKYARTW